MEDFDNMDPTAQGQTAETVAPEAAPQNAPVEAGGQPAPQDDAFKAGIQKRIDELTKHRRQAEANLVQRDTQIAELQRMNMELMLRMQQPQEPAPQIDDEFRRGTEAVVSPQLKAMQAQMAALQQQVAVTQAEAEFARHPEEVAAQARQMYQQMSRAGVPLNARDAVTFVYGQLAMQGQAPGVQQPRGAGGRFTAPPPLSGHSAAAPRVSASQKPIPADIDQRSPEEQEAFWASRLGDSKF